MSQCKCLKITHDYTAFCRAIKKNHVACVATLVHQRRELESLLIYRAAKAGHLEIMESLVTAGCPWNPHTFNVALATGNLALVQYLKERGCPVPFVKFNYNGHLHILQYLYEQGYELSSDICISAAKNGWCDCLKYAISISCPLSEEVALTAFNAGRTKILDLLYDNDCELPLICSWNNDSIVRKGQLQVLKHLEEQGLPLPIMK